MTQPTFDFTVFDTEGDQLAQLARRFPEKKVLALYRTGPRVGNISYFSEGGDPILFADTQEAARSAKLAFLRSADTCLVIVRDLRGLEFFTTALRLLLADQLTTLIAISRGDLERLINGGTEDEQRRARQLLREQRLCFRKALNWSDFDHR
jgi:hypothetical protein